MGIGDDDQVVACDKAKSGAALNRHALDGGGDAVLNALVKPHENGPAGKWACMVWMGKSFNFCKNFRTFQIDAGWDGYHVAPIGVEVSRDRIVRSLRIWRAGLDVIGPTDSEGI